MVLPGSLSTPRKKSSPLRLQELPLPLGHTTTPHHPLPKPQELSWCSRETTPAASPLPATIESLNCDYPDLDLWPHSWAGKAEKKKKAQDLEKDMPKFKFHSLSPATSLRQSPTLLRSDLQNCKLGPLTGPSLLVVGEVIGQGVLNHPAPSPPAPASIPPKCQILFPSNFSPAGHRIMRNENSRPSGDLTWSPPNSQRDRQVTYMKCASVSLSL